MNGLRAEPSPLEDLAPALDIILSRAYDIPHSEWKGLGKQLHQLLIDSVLTPVGLSGYVSAFQHFHIPLNWPRIQNPRNHHGSWSLSEYGCAIIITPLILRCHSTPAWFKRPYQESAQAFLEELLPEKTSFSSSESIIYAFACFARAVSAVSMPVHRSISHLRHLVHKGREAYQRLVLASTAEPSNERRFIRVNGN